MGRSSTQTACRRSAKRPQQRLATLACALCEALLNLLFSGIKPFFDQLFSLRFLQTESKSPLCGLVVAGLKLCSIGEVRELLENGCVVAHDRAATEGTITVAYDAGSTKTELLPPDCSFLFAHGGTIFLHSCPFLRYAGVDSSENMSTANSRSSRRLSLLPWTWTVRTTYSYVHFERQHL